MPVCLPGPAPSPSPLMADLQSDFDVFAAAAGALQGEFRRSGEIGADALRRVNDTLRAMSGNY